VACGLLKIGLLCDPALPFVGKLWLADIGFPPFLLEKIQGRVMDSPTLPARPPDAYKGSMGSLLIVGGSLSYSGAVTMALRSAIKSGVGLVYAAVPGSIRETVAVAVPEAVVLGLEETREGNIAPSAFEALLPVLEACRAVLIGPGLGKSEASAELTKKFWFGSFIPMVLDADALIPQLANLERQAPAILTPHPGEAARLLGIDAAAIQLDRRQAAFSISERFAAVAVLKGARSLVADGSSYRVLAETSPLLATAGSGDVLAGLMGGLLAQSFPPFEAASLAVSLHGRMGSIAQQDGRRSLSALEVLDYFDRALSSIPLSSGRPERIY
jgi:NAD(P)H-hydrate epimerase